MGINSKAREILVEVGLFPTSLLTVGLLYSSRVELPQAHISWPKLLVLLLLLHMLLCGLLILGVGLGLGLSLVVHHALVIGLVLDHLLLSGMEMMVTWRLV
jgi:hypothetical protein